MSAAGGGTEPLNEVSEAFLALGGWPGVLSRLFRREDLTGQGATLALGEILDGRASPVQVAAFLSALRTKGESVEEITGLAAAMRGHGESLEVPDGAIDTCGTGGDRSGTVNVSTMAALVAAGAGVPVCKHGGGASSSLSGSADVLRELGVAIDLGPSAVATCVAEVGIGFCFAPRFHPAMRHAGPIRSELRVPTIFNFLGPLCNPAGVLRQVVGVGDATMAEKMLGVLEANGARHVLVVYGHDGLDELTTTGPSTVLESRVGEDGVRRRSTSELVPEALGLDRARPETLLGGDAAHNAGRARALLSGEAGPQRDFLLMNAAAALLVAGAVSDLGDGVELARATIDSGAATKVLDGLARTSQLLASAPS